MSVSLQVFEKDVTLNVASIFMATLSQQVVSFLWYGVTFSSVYCYFYAVDKGVKRAEYAIRRYGVSFKVLASLAANLVRAVLIAIVVGLAGPGAARGGDTACALCRYLEIGGLVGAMTLIPVTADLWADRPLPLVLVNAGGSIVFALAAAAVLYFTKDIMWGAGDL